MYFDVFQRYLDIYRLAQRETAAAAGRTIRMLDVGSNGPGFAVFNLFNNLEQTNIDVVEASQETRSSYPRVTFLTYPGDRLPFADDSFDIVVSVDVLEHVPPEKRAGFIREAIRVSRKHIIFVFPVRSSAPWERFLSAITLRRIKFLEEHIRYGLPREQDLYTAIQPLDHVQLVRESGNMNIGLWIPLKLASSLSLRLLRRRPDLVFRSFVIYQSTFARWVNWGQCYSKTFVLEKR